jgi:Protein of unknown function (DUF2857)
MYSMQGEPGLTYQLLGFISRRIRAGDIEQLIREGVPVEVIDMLRTMTADQLTDLAGSRDALFAVRVESSAFQRAVKGVQHTTKWSELQSYFVQHGATVQMMQSLFRLSRSNIRELRRWICAEPPSLMMPSEQAREELLAAWHSLHSVADARERLKLLHQQFASRFPLRALWQIVDEATSSTEPKTRRTRQPARTSPRRIPAET